MLHAASRGSATTSQASNSGQRVGSSSSGSSGVAPLVGSDLPWSTECTSASTRAAPRRRATARSSASRTAEAGAARGRAAPQPRRDGSSAVATAGGRAVSSSTAARALSTLRTTACGMAAAGAARRRTASSHPRAAAIARCDAQSHLTLARPDQHLIFPHERASSVTLPGCPPSSPRCRSHVAPHSRFQAILTLV